MSPRILAITLGLFSSTLHAQIADLDRFIGIDLRLDPLSERDSRKLEEIIGPARKGIVLDFRPWNVWRTTRAGVTRYIVLSVEPLFSIPGEASACVQLFDASLKRIASWSFPTGWRISPESASFEYSKELSSDLLTLYVSRYINSHDIAKEYFAIANDRLQLVRLESRDGEALQNEYIDGNWEIGVVPAATTEDQWIFMLESKDPIEVLSALTFLGGRHIKESDRKFTSEPSESKYGALFLQLLGSPRIREIIARLGYSDSQWIRQAADLAAREPRERHIQ